MTITRDITDFSPTELTALLGKPLDARTKRVVLAEIARRPEPERLLTTYQPDPEPASLPALHSARTRPAGGKDDDTLLTPAEVAALFRVDPKTVTRWANQGKLSTRRTLGGHRRYLSSEINALLRGGPIPKEGNDIDRS
jgi:excisionase family DNA binding protein